MLSEKELGEILKWLGKFTMGEEWARICLLVDEIRQLREETRRLHGILEQVADASVYSEVEMVYAIRLAKRETGGEA